MRERVVADGNPEKPVLRAAEFNLRSVARKAGWNRFVTFLHAHAWSLILVPAREAKRDLLFMCIVKKTMDFTIYYVSIPISLNCVI